MMLQGRKGYNQLKDGVEMDPSLADFLLDLVTYVKLPTTKKRDLETLADVVRFILRRFGANFNRCEKTIFENLCKIMWLKKA